MYKVHIFLDNKRMINQRMEHIPKLGDTIRFPKEKFAKVTEVIWCLDEKAVEDQRVNLRTESMEIS